MAWLKQCVYAAPETDHAALGFVVRGVIATPSMVRARNRYSDAVNAVTLNLRPVGAIRLRRQSSSFPFLQTLQISIMIGR